MATKETTMSVAQMNFILIWKISDNRDSRSHNVCVSSDKLGLFCPSAIFSFSESYAPFGDKPTRPKK